MGRVLRRARSERSFHPHHKLYRKEQIYTLSSRAQPRDLQFSLMGKTLANRKQNCHPDRSAAEWRDLRFHFLEQIEPGVGALPFARIAATVPYRRTGSAG